MNNDIMYFIIQCL